MAKAGLTFFYIVEPPDYQILACTLLASIRTHFGRDVAAVGYCPEHRWDDLHPAVFKAHAMMGAEIRPVRTEGMWDTPYPHGNKIIAAMQPRDSAWSAFVDSDVLFIRENAPAAITKPGHVSCSVAESMVWADQDLWPPIYAALDLPLPEERIEYMRRPVGPVLPYFSSGLVTFEEGGPTPFPEVWYDTARRVDRIEGLDNTRPYLDQMSLPAAILRSQRRWNILPEEQHYILGGRIRKQPLPQDRAIHTLHYRNRGVLKEVGLYSYAKSMLAAQTGVPYVRRLVPEALQTQEAQT
ncbi:hypothetical protein [Tranquillimonas rosea]|uniref:hypothetical protein n=1 Tax=Tranquillimonas rosea TaxID=641238 RepID=UPI003BA9B62C